MATVNLGRIKPVYRGVYNNSTAYVVDDMVQYTDSGILSTYICTTASQGNAPSSSGTAHGSWAYLAKGVAEQTVDLSGIKSDITALGIREATNEASAAFNLPNSFIDTFASDVLGTKTNVLVDSGGYIYAGSSSVGSNVFETETNSRASTYDLTDTFQTALGLYSSSGSLAKMIDGTVPAADDGGANYYLHAGGNTASEDTHYMRWDRKAGNSAIYTGFKYWNQNNSTQYGSTDNWKIKGSNDATNWTTLHTFTWTHNASNPTSHTWSNTTAYRYIQITPNSSVTTSQATWQREYVWGISAVTNSINATGTAIQAANTVGSSKTKVSGTMMYKDNAGTATLGTDLKIYFTCNGGSNWTEAASYNAITPVYSTGIKQVRLGETTCTAGTDIRYKAVWANQASGSKETQLHAIGLNY